MVTTTHASIWSWIFLTRRDADGGPGQTILLNPLLRRARAAKWASPETQRRSGKARRYRYGYEGRVLAS